MPVNDHLDSGSRRIEVKLAQVVQNVDQVIIDGPRLCEWEIDQFTIHISANGNHGRKCFETLKHTARSQITGVNDQVHILQSSRHRVAQEPVRIGNNCEAFNRIKCKCPSFHLRRPPAVDDVNLSGCVRRLVRSEVGN